jgi:predicted DCC family thiol-disulfide oxidoreductase YuxK
VLLDDGDGESVGNAIAVQRPPAESGRHLLLYDGVCGLCDVLVQAVLARDRRVLFHFASLQSAAARATLDRFGSNPDELTTFYVVTNYRDAKPIQLTKGRAALFVITALGWPWKVAGLLKILPDRVLDGIYDLIARHRYRIFGRYETCLVPRPEYRSRFIDSQQDESPTSGIER